MSPKQKILAIKLSDKLLKKPDYAKAIGIEIKNTAKKEKSD